MNAVTVFCVTLLTSMLCITSVNAASKINNKPNRAPTSNTAPIAENTFFTIESNQQTIGQIIATDAEGDTLSYRLDKSNRSIFTLSKTGFLRVKDTASLEINTPYAITIQVSDPYGAYDYANITVEAQQVSTPNDTLPPPPLEIITQPTNITTTTGDAFMLSVVVNTPDIPLEYQWYLNGTPLINGNNAHYAISFARLSHTGIYSVEVSSNGQAVISHNATVSIVDDIAHLTWNAPVTRADGTYLSTGEIAQYIIYWGTEAEGFIHLTYVSESTEHVFDNLQNTTYFFKIKTQSTDGLESGFSDTASKTFN